MNGVNYLLDTCFIIEMYNGHQEVIKTITQNGVILPLCAISPINRMEVLGFTHLSDNDSQNIDKLLANLTTLAIDKNIENTVIDLRKRHKIKLPDAIILATALNYRLELLSLDSNLMHKYHQESKLS